MVNQKSDGFRSLTGFHGGLRRGTAAAAFGAVLVLSAGVPASNAAAAELPASDLLGDSEHSGTGLAATVDAAGLKAWAAAALSTERDSPAEPAPSESPSAAPSESPSVPPSLSPLVPAPAPSMTISASPTPAVPVPSPSVPVPLPSVPVPTVPVPTAPVQTGPAPSPARTSSGTPAPSRSAAPAPSSAETSPSGTQSPSGAASPSGSWSGSSAGTAGSSPAGQAPAGPAPAGSAPGSSAPGTVGSPAAESSAATAETPAAEASPFAAITGLSGGAGLRGRSAAGVAGGVWGSAELSGPNNMATISSPYMRGPAESAVMGVSQNGTIAPQVWWGAGLLALAGAAGVAAVRLRRAL
ncbi:hypothetical protein [Arthrobacter sp. NPDC056727]|uniref:hypothetical protein n=1 Tax=Arthrobacter sp. NPDC056727 TaxID=3345927 RepID=UPI00366A9C0E